MSKDFVAWGTRRQDLAIERVDRSARNHTLREIAIQLLLRKSDTTAADVSMAIGAKGSIAGKSSVHTDSAACQKTEYRKHQENEEADPRGSIGHSTDQTKSKETGEQCNHKECQGKV